MEKPDIGFDDLKRWLLEWSGQDLRRVNAPYVAEFQMALQSRNGDIEGATNYARGVLREGRPHTRELLTRLLDFELSRSKVARALAKLRAAAYDTSDAGDEFEYHWDHWLFQISACLARFDKLVTAAFRTTARAEPAVRGAQLKKLRSDFTEDTRSKIDPYRDPLAHGGGPVEGVDPHWEPFLACPNYVDAGMRLADDLTKRVRGGIAAEVRTRWHSQIYAANVVVFALLEAYSGRALNELAGLQ